MEAGSVFSLIGCHHKPSSEGFFLNHGNLFNQQPTCLFITTPAQTAMTSVVVSVRSFCNGNSLAPLSRKRHHVQVSSQALCL